MGFFERLKTGLSRARKALFEGLSQILKGSKISDEILEELEERLLMADVGYPTTEYIIEQLKQSKTNDALETLKEIMIDLLSFDSKLNSPDQPPFVITVVGVNGTGKTTTVAKLAAYFQSTGKTVVLGAADTFRAAAIEQLREWGERTGSTVIYHSEGADSAAVAFDAVSHAKAREKDVVIIDTAGRLHTKKNLMEELKKVHRVIGKVVPGAPHEVLLVIDATTGQNGLVQAKVFKEMVDVTGIVITKLDGTAKGGISLAIKKELNLPIKFIGIGEGAEDLKPFDAKEFVEALID
ncbi:MULTISPECIES: signal recognition particle-docking protein FtsY [Pseudothermotoga]|jgi:fused signal recognition particle receptor|uniref:Signal recognition particle receptor FtsY n=1 Tax=Pseudothermotoga lettingae (strain ATCC BAA-301 / DSM 14385 / NBRC 107922 / TMO) TaxID=416591 RepID=A8F3T1_PSELT|nr:MULTISPECIES: signal recognition particle-docking protein FtsY [Pseudothermotoga]ABV32815.1 signal recognition particle-docking protein FtsY [Pseudothermotoga lettingae TMO]KUK20424.1 MAG: Signal recognition particle receptor FtsY [Pseudothermotoga lettingae]MDI3495130.1 fused signal recognition particle receptor [Pseudothermotoga sp.]MDK2885174.1 fused signal recognition particle receptor [Pseudothermotoga sp.]GLI48189.1 signal recognition particle receptor FtsY [Pseudothermotoga lettingae